MNLTCRPSNRHCVVRPEPRPTPARLRQLLLEGVAIERGFHIIQAPVPAHDDTRLLVAGNEREVVIGACFYDSVPRLSRAKNTSSPDTCELFFDLRHDGLGYVQYYFQPSPPPATGEPVNPHRDRELANTLQVITHQPYPEYASSAARLPMPRDFKFSEEGFSKYHLSGTQARWIWVRFDAAELFAWSPVVGFNLCRNRPYIEEFSSWNYLAGNGAQDGHELGRLYHQPPATWTLAEATRDAAGTLTLTGSVSGAPATAWELTLINPLGEAVPLQPQWQGQDWRATLPVAGAPHGCWRLTARPGDLPVEPAWWSVDLPSVAAAKAFRLSMTYDPPMCILPQPYTPVTLARDMAAVASLGVSRIHWIEYSNYRSFWEQSGRPWSRHYAATAKACGDWLATAVRTAHDLNLEFFADFKTFDLGFNCFFVPPRRGHTVEDLEGKAIPVIPEIAQQQAATMQAHPSLQRRFQTPAVLRYWSTESLPTYEPGRLSLLVSLDNQHWTPYTGPMTLTQERRRRRHDRWTPAGTRPEAGSEMQWVIEFTGLQLPGDYVALRLDGAELELVNRAWRLVEGLDQHGAPMELTIATNGTCADGFYFWKGWPGWSNITEGLLQVRHWRGRELGSALWRASNHCTLLEPACAAAQKIWLDRVDALLAKGVDGVDLRTYCHHNGVDHYLNYVWHPELLAAFTARHGRPPSTTPEDYTGLRQLRGEAYTRFIRGAKARCAAAGKKLIVELESGIEVPPHLDCRMALPMEWEIWLKERLVDEVRLKWFTPRSRFVHERLLPLARRQGIPVAVISRNLPTSVGLRSLEWAEHTVAAAAAAGFSGYSYYEQQNLMELNPAGYPIWKGPVAEHFAAVRAALARQG